MVDFRQISIIFTGYLWHKAASNKYCTNYVSESSANTQKGCQGLCEAKSESECVGITYSHKIRFTEYCYLCKDDTLSEFGSGFGSGSEFCFYRRTGMFKVCFYG